MHALHPAQVAYFELKRFGQLKHPFVPLLLLGTPILSLLYGYFTAEIFTVWVVVAYRSQFELSTGRAFFEFVVGRALSRLLFVSFRRVEGVRFLFTREIAS